MLFIKINLFFTIIKYIYINIKNKVNLFYIKQSLLIILKAIKKKNATEP